MDERTQEILAVLNGFLQDLDVSEESWDSASRIMLVVYGKLMELSAELAPPGAMGSVARGHLGIATSLKSLSEIIKDRGK